jgi:hypothetical protein
MAVSAEMGRIRTPIFAAFSQFASHAAINFCSICFFLSFYTDK